jgi:hypothetical protein
MAKTVEETKAIKREKLRKWRQAHPEQVLETNRKWKQAHPEQVRESNRKHKYGARDGVYAQLMIKQNGCCAICGGNRSKKILGIDHDHTTKEVRGLLCGKCNVAIGYMDDNPDWLHKAANYLTTRNAGKD